MLQYWTGDPPSKCDLCDIPIVRCFIDGKTSLELWGFMCQSCHFTDRFGLGVGRGQKYVKQLDGRWLKIS